MIITGKLFYWTDHLDQLKSSEKLVTEYEYQCHSLSMYFRFKIYYDKNAYFLHLMKGENLEFSHLTHINFVRVFFVQFASNSATF